MPVTLDQILDTTRGACPALTAPGGRRRAGGRGRRRAPVARAARSGGETVAVIAEVKRRSPSAGVIREDLDPARAGGAVRGAGCGGDLGPHRRPVLRRLGGAISARPPPNVAVPVLRKDFILDELQVLEARAAGAAAVLLIVRALPRERLDGAARDIAARAGARRAGRGPHRVRAGRRARGRRPDRRGQQPRSRHLPHRHRGRLAAARSGCPRDVVAVAESGMAERADVVRAPRRPAPTRS